MSTTSLKKPSNGHKTESPARYSNPFGSMMENFFNDNLFSGEFPSAVPAVNVSEDKDNYSVEISAPGFKKGDFRIEADNRVLTISAEHKSESEEKSKTYTRKEFSYGSFKRVFSLPDSVNEESIDAKYENGVLNIILPKKEEAKAKPVKEIKIS
jgi:HSP20 family protein